MALGRKSPGGLSAVAQRPRWRVIATVLRRQSPVFLILALPPFAAATAEAAWPLAAALGGAAAAALLAVVGSRGAALPEDVRRSEALLSLAVAFGLCCLATAPAYWALGLAPLDALFEATSALTTTGFSMATTLDGWPLAAHFLRAWSQWCGGLVIAVAGIAFLLDRGPVARVLGMADFGDARLGSSTGTHARALLLAYLGVTLFGMAGALLLFPDAVEGALLVLAAVSTGGMAPRGDSLASYPAAAQSFVVLLSALGAVSLAFPVLAWRHRLAAAAETTGVASLLKAFALVAAVYAAVLFAAEGPDLARLGPGLLNLVSLQSTTGFTVAPVTTAPPLLLVLMLAMAIGGQTGSTVGGLKLDRIRILLGATRLVLGRLLSPSHALTYFRIGGEIVDPDRLIFTAALCVTYAAAAMMMWVAFTLAEEPALSSLFDIFSALSTVGAGTGVIGPDLAPALKALTILAMLLGRLEFFALILLALPGTWIRKD